jgi:hypothetical protein
VWCLDYHRDTQIEELATKHNVTKQHVEKLMNNSTHYKKPHMPNLANTLVHMKANELNEGIYLISLSWVSSK